MRILQLTGFYPPVIGGIEAYVKELSEALVRQGNEVTVIARYKIGERPKHNVEKVKGVKIIWLWSKKNSKINTIITWIKALFIALKEDFDIVHAHTILPINLVGNVLKIVKKKRLVCTIHETHFQQGIKNPAYRTIAKASLNMADFITGISDDITGKANSLNLKKKAVTSKNAVDTSTYKKIKSSIIRDDTGIGKSTKVIITTRRLVEKNGVVYLVRAIPHLLKKADFFLYLIGSGPEKAMLEEEIKKLGIENRVRINSRVETKDIPAYLSDADIFALPSLIEGMSMSAMEAMSCSLPIVATNVGGNPQFVKQGKNGYLCNPRDPKGLAEKIALAAKNKKMLGKESRKIIEAGFSWDERIKEFKKIYKGT